VALCRTYLDTTGQVLHHNIDKGLLVAGQTTPGPGRWDGAGTHAPHHW
jgi:S-adenosylmethionine synthetase